MAEPEQGETVYLADATKGKCTTMVAPSTDATVNSSPHMTIEPTENPETPPDIQNGRPRKPANRLVYHLNPYHLARGY